MMIFAIIMGINLLGDGIRDALDPRLAEALRRSQPLTKMSATCRCQHLKRVGCFLPV